MSYGNISIGWGFSNSKIHAINRDMPELSEYLIIICVSDDMIFNLYGFDDIIRVNMNAIFPAFDGLLHYLDKDTQGSLATLYIAGVNWYKMRGNIYHESYQSLWSDNEEMQVAKLLNKHHFVGTLIYWHANPAYYPAEGRDAKFDHDQSLWDVDEKNFKEREARNFDL
jgi:hypothetical protein